MEGMGQQSSLLRELYRHGRLWKTIVSAEVNKHICTKKAYSRLRKEIDIDIDIDIEDKKLTVGDAEELNRNRRQRRVVVCTERI